MNWFSRNLNRLSSWVRSQLPVNQFTQLEAPTDPEVGNISSSQNAIIPPSETSALQVIQGLAGIILSRENLPRISIATGLTALSTGLNFLSPYLFSKTIEALSKDEEQTTIAGTEVSKTFLISLMIVSYTLCQTIPMLRDQIMVPVTNNNVKKVLEQSTAHLLKKSLEYHVKTPFPDQVYFLQKGFSLSTVGTPLLTQVAPTLVEITIACVALSSQYGVEMGVGLFALISAYTTYSAFMAKRIIQSREQMLKAGNEAYQSFVNAVKNYKNMRDFGKFEPTMDEVSRTLLEMTKADNYGLNLPLTVSQGHIAIARLSMLLAAVYVGTGIQTRQFKIEDFIILISYLNQLSALLPGFGSALNSLFSSWPDLKFVLGELMKGDEVIDKHPNVALKIDTSLPAIEFKGVSYFYDQSKGCGLVRMSENPQELGIEELQSLLANNVSYVLFNSEVYYVDSSFKAKKIGSLTVDKLNKIFPAEMNTLQTAMKENLSEITSLTGHTPEKTVERVVLFTDLSFIIQEGQKVAIVSASGAGKTTIFNLICRYFEPQAGEIKIYGQNIRDVSLYSLQQKITLFGQNPNLFNGTVRANILFGSPTPKEVSDEMIWALAEKAGLADFLKSLAKQLDTEVGEDGTALSGGQQQKVSILRGLMKPSPIQLMDEITASIDSRSAREVLQGLDRLFSNRTCLIITHKLTEVKCADLILVLENGKVSAQGTHETLLSSCDLYRQLWQAYRQEEQPNDFESSSSTNKMLQVLEKSTEPTVELGPSQTSGPNHYLNLTDSEMEEVDDEHPGFNASFGPK